jgi:very-short-patch-repair endonuclease
MRQLRNAGRTVVDVTVGTRTGRRHGDVIVHSAGSLRPEDVSVVDGIPATSVARTLLDCAAVLGRRGTERLVVEAERLQVFDLDAVLSLLAHVPGHHGAATLRAAVGDAAGARGHTASDVEDALLVAFRAAGLPEPECNAAIRLADGSFVHPDFLWRDASLIVEADPRGTHDRTANYRSDRTRDRALARLGYETMRFNDVELRDPAACAAETAERHSLRAATARKL